MTLYDRIVLYCTENQVLPPDKFQRAALGESVTEKVKPLGKITSFEFGHFIPVNNYPESANATIDILIQKFYAHGKKEVSHR